MAIRSRLKKRLKTLLGRNHTPEETSPISTPPPPPPKPEPEPKINLEPVSPSLEVSAPEEAKEEPIEETPIEEVVAPEIETPEEQTPEPIEEAEPEESAESAPEESTDGAAAVFEIKNLFPESCPSCEAPSHNNWKWFEGAFVCGSCDEEY